MKHYRFIILLGLLAGLVGLLRLPVSTAKPEPNNLSPDGSAADQGSGGTIASRIAPPAGYQRRPYPATSFGSWLRNLPLRPGQPPVHLYDGRLKGNQQAHYAVVARAVGQRDLQQCADAVIRLRAEYLFERGCPAAIQFHFTSGDLAKWSDWQRGLRPMMRGNKVTWRQTARADASPANFRRYLDQVFTYAGTASLARELETLAPTTKPESGDVFIQGGSPGHAVIVVDVAENPAGERIFLLAQSYMPAQEIQILKSYQPGLEPWYRFQPQTTLETPEWSFAAGSLKRFGTNQPEAACP